MLHRLGLAQRLEVLGHGRVEDAERVREADLAERSPRVVVNLASQEYFGAIDTGRLDAR